MAKKKQNNELLQEAYSAVCRMLNLRPHMSVNEQVHKMIYAADDIQVKICEAADHIKVNAYDKVKEWWPELGIPKPTWLELVHIRRLQRHTTLSDDFIDKIARSFDAAKNITALRMTIIDAIKTNNLEHANIATIDSEKKLEFESTETLPEDFITLLNECADLRDKIDTEMWPSMRLIGDAFCYLTKEKYQVFKRLLDLWHYRNGGWPSEKTPPLVWKPIAGFLATYDLLERYDFDLCKTWCKRFGLSTERTLQSPTVNVFSKTGAIWGKYFMAKLKDDLAGKYPQYPFKPWHHIIANNGIGFAYVWDTRNVDFVINMSDLDITDLTTPWGDNLQPLKATDADILAKLNELMPDIVYKKPEPKEEHPVGWNMPTAENIDKLRAEILEAVLKDCPDKAQAMQIIESDKIDKYYMQYKHPEIGMEHGTDYFWTDGDRAYNEHLGYGTIVGADEETGNLIFRSDTYFKDFPMWIWHLIKCDKETDEFLKPHDPNNIPAQYFK